MVGEENDAEVEFNRGDGAREGLMSGASIGGHCWNAMGWGINLDDRSFE